MSTKLKYIEIIEIKKWRNIPAVSLFVWCFGGVPLYTWVSSSVLRLKVYLPPLFLPASLGAWKTGLESQEKCRSKTEKWPFLGLPLDPSAGLQNKSWSSSDSLQVGEGWTSRPLKVKKINNFFSLEPHTQNWKILLFLVQLQLVQIQVVGADRAWSALSFGSGPYLLGPCSWWDMAQILPLSSSFLGDNNDKSTQKDSSKAEQGGKRQPERPTWVEKPPEPNLTHPKGPQGNQKPTRQPGGNSISFSNSIIIIKIHCDYIKVYSKHHEWKQNYHIKIL